MITPQKIETTSYQLEFDVRKTAVATDITETLAAFRQLLATDETIASELETTGEVRVTYLAKLQNGKTFCLNCNVSTW